MQIIPAVLAKSEEEFIEKVAHVRALGLPVHVDVMDGKFVKNETWATPEKMAKIMGDLPFEAHLMVSNPEHLVPVWLAAGATRVFYHAEVTRADQYIVRSIVPEGEKLGIAFNPDTPVSRIIPYLDDIHHVMIMAVEPGLQGQAFQEIAVEKVEALRRAKPSVTIGVDGGVKPENAKRILDAGADFIVVGSALANEPDAQAALGRFHAALR